MTGHGDDDRLNTALETIDASKRVAMRKLLVGAAFVPPVVASFAINGMMVTSAQAQGIDELEPVQPDQPDLTVERDSHIQ